MELKGSRTEANLMAAFAGESQARNKYTFYASQAKKEGFEQIAALFTETANNEKEHAKMRFKLLIGGIAFFYGIMHAKPSLAGGPPEAQFPILGWAIGAVAAPVALLLIVHLSGLWVSNTLERERQPGKPGSGRMVPKRLR